jgi:asparagine synthetase B (glutamine-hydrolysing)
MCGIYASISTHALRGPVPSEAAKQLLCKRGPDHIGESHKYIELKDDRPCWISLFSTVLALRGSHITEQPYICASSGSSLCWNGEAWSIGQDTVVGNDGQAIFDLLIGASSAQSTSEASAAIIKVVQSIAGPFAFVFVDKVHGQVYFGRDRLGRRSLLYKTDGSPACLELASIADPSSGCWSEVEADAIYQLSYSERNSKDGSDSLDLRTRLLPNAVGPVKMHLWNDDSTVSPQSSIAYCN